MTRNSVLKKSFRVCTYLIALSIGYYLPHTSNNSRIPTIPPEPTILPKPTLNPITPNLENLPKWDNPELKKFMEDTLTRSILDARDLPQSVKEILKTATENDLRNVLKMCTEVGREQCVIDSLAALECVTWNDIKRTSSLLPHDDHQHSKYLYKLRNEKLTSCTEPNPSLENIELGSQYKKKKSGSQKKRIRGFNKVLP